jgi:predicted glycosyl hydrolase (DUF1957 family)
MTSLARPCGCTHDVTVFGHTWCEAGPPWVRDRIRAAARERIAQAEQRRHAELARSRAQKALDTLRTRLSRPSPLP